MKKLLFIISFLIVSQAVFSQKRVTPYRSIEDRLNEQYCTGLFKTTDGTYFDLMDDRVYASAAGYINILDWLQGRVAGLQIYKTNSNLSIPFIRNQRAGVFLDEMPVSADWLNALPISDIAMIKVIKQPFIGNFRGAGGAIAIYTIQGGDEDEEE